MSFIPNDAMPHATVEALEHHDDERQGHRSIFRWLSDTARENPRKAMGAGALVLAGAALAASVPFISPAKPVVRPKRRAPAKAAAKASSARSRANGGGANGSKPKTRAKSSPKAAKTGGAGRSAKRPTSRARKPGEAARGPAS
jgi:hypothetical protein